MSQVVINFYKFTPLEEPEQYRRFLTEKFHDLAVLGTILLAKEGINGALSGDKKSLKTAMSVLHSIKDFSDLSTRESYATTNSFNRLKIRVKDKVLAFPQSYEPTINEINASANLDAKSWQKAIRDHNNTVILDTRNDYEFELGSFDGAEHLGIKKFNEFADAFIEKYSNDTDKEKTFLMFCTGGIRCEKAAAFVRKQGFKKVFKLDGGIIQYFEDVGKSLWRGECFVFDHRAAIATDRQETAFTFISQKEKDAGRL